MPAMGNITLLFLFFILIFGVIGQQLFQGDFINRCISTDGKNSILYPTIDSSKTFDLFCDIIDADLSNKTSQCDYGHKCTKYTNPDFGLSNFDNIFFSMYKTFEILTLENWTPFMYQCRQYYKNDLYDIFSILIVVLGAFVLLSLMVAVLSD